MSAGIPSQGSRPGTDRIRRIWHANPSRGSLAQVYRMNTPSRQQSEVPYGTLDLLVLKTLEAMGRMHGYAIARRIEQVAGDSLRLSQGSVYPALIRLEQEGWISTEWGVSETSRKVKFYSLTRAGRKQLLIEVAKWEKTMALVTRFLEASS